MAASDAAISRVSFQSLRDYLKARDWVLAPSKRSEIAIFRSPPPGPEREVLVPLDRELADYARAIDRAAETIAAFESREPKQVLRDLIRPRKDVLRFGLSGQETAGGTIDLEQGENLVKGIKRALLASACGIARPRRYHPRLALSQADAYVRGCTLGQTEIGSFVVTVDAPLEIAGDLTTAEDFGRRATSHLMKATATLSDALLRGEPELIAEADDEHALVSANLCDALLEMMSPDQNADLHVRTNWSPMMAPPADVRQHVKIDRGAYSDIEALGDLLRPSDGPKQGSFVAYVRELHGLPNLTGKVEGDVTLSVFHDEQLLSARVELGPEHYEIAAGAHLQVVPVVVVGRFERGRRSSKITNVTDFRRTP